MRGEESLIPEATDAAKLLDMLHTHKKLCFGVRIQNSQKWLKTQSFCQCEIDFLCLLSFDNTRFDN